MKTRRSRCLGIDIGGRFACGGEARDHTLIRRWICGLCLLGVMLAGGCADSGDTDSVAPGPPSGGGGPGAAEGAGGPGPFEIYGLEEVNFFLERLNQRPFGMGFYGSDEPALRLIFIEPDHAAWVIVLTRDGLSGTRFKSVPPRPEQRGWLEVASFAKDARSLEAVVDRVDSPSVWGPPFEMVEYFLYVARLHSIMALELAQHSMVRTFLMPSADTFLLYRPSHEDLMSPLPAQSAFLHAFATTFTELAGDLMTEADFVGWREFLSELEGLEW